MNFNPCIVIPVYNHGSTMASTLKQLAPMAMTCVVIDDGSDNQTKSILAELSHRYDCVRLITLNVNGGKGGAVIAGLKEASRLGYSHAVQVDADGQHNLADVPVLLSAAKNQPNALISGLPQYNESVPKARLYGRYITHFWVWVETLSFSIKDAMCGFRVYPLAASLCVIECNAVGSRMDFDTDIMVRMYWMGTEVSFVPTAVDYPVGGVSHFLVFKDNLRISWMHTRLVAGMLLRLPKLLASKWTRLSCKQYNHWAQMREKGSYSGMAFSLICYRVFGRRALMLLLYPIIAYFFLTSRYVRQQSQHFLQRVYVYAQDHNVEVYFKKRPTLLDSYRHLMNFGCAIVDRIGVNSGEIQRETLLFERRSELLQLAKDRVGCVIMASHLGSTEMMRALIEQVPDVKMNVLVFSNHLQHFNKFTEKLGNSDRIELIQIATLDPGTAVQLKEKIDAGEFVVVSSDRTPADASGRIIYSPFLGHEAPFPQGVFILASLMACPVYLLFCLKVQNRHSVYFEKFSEKIVLPRKQRLEKLQECVNNYAQRLQYYVCKAPLQWFNFYDFWNNNRS